MKGSQRSLPGAATPEGVNVHEADWGDIHVSFQSYKTSYDVTPLLQGLPDNLCQSPHWGYILKGEILVTYKSGIEERITEGNAYYLPPGHTIYITGGTEYVEFSPVDVYNEMAVSIIRNIHRALSEPIATAKPAG